MGSGPQEDGLVRLWWIAVTRMTEPSDCGEKWSPGCLNYQVMMRCGPQDDGTVR